MIKKIFVLSHTDLDGYFSGALVEYFHKQTFPECIFKHQSWTYGRELPDTDSIIKNYDSVFIVDLCPGDDFMFKLYNHFRSKFVWIDHHVKPNQSFLEKFDKIYNSNPNSAFVTLIPGRRETTEHRNSAASLCWEYYSAKPVPKWLKLISEFDTWNRTDETRWQNEIMPMFTYLKSKVTSVKEALQYIKQREFLDTLDDESTTNKEIAEGVIMYKTIKALYNAEAKHGFGRQLPITIKSTGKTDTINAWICNTQERSSVIFEDMKNRDDYDVFIPYHYNGEKYFYSMYTFSPDISCNDIIINDDKESLEFNGHKDAAGSNSKYCPFI